MTTERFDEIAETTDGIAVGEAAADGVLTLRAHDGSDTGASRTLGAGRPKRKEGT